MCRIYNANEQDPMFELTGIRFGIREVRRKNYTRKNAQHGYGLLTGLNNVELAGLNNVELAGLNNVVLASMNKT